MFSRKNVLDDGIISLINLYTVYPAKISMYRWCVEEITCTLRRKAVTSQWQARKAASQLTTSCQTLKALWRVLNYCTAVQWRESSSPTLYVTGANEVMSAKRIPLEVTNGWIINYKFSFLRLVYRKCIDIILETILRLIFDILLFRYTLIIRSLTWTIKLI